MYLAADPSGRKPYKAVTDWYFHGMDAACRLNKNAAPVF